MAKKSIFELLDGVTRFGRLTVVGEGGRSSDRARRAHCRCDCGVERDVVPGHLVNGHTTSCGCYGATRGAARTRTHGRARTVEYAAWRDMKARCFNSNVKNYPDYGGRGITVCDRWRSSFEAFFADMGPKPTPLHSLDRIDNDGIYEPSNCQWQERVGQNRNRRGRVWIEHAGERLSIQEAAARIGATPDTIRLRIKLGWSMEDVLTRPLRSAR